MEKSLVQCNGAGLVWLFQFQSTSTSSWLVHRLDDPFMRHHCQHLHKWEMMYYLNTVFLNSIVALKLYSKIEERAFFLLLPKKKNKNAAYFRGELEVECRTRTTLGFWENLYLHVSLCLMTLWLSITLCLSKWHLFWS